MLHEPWNFCKCGVLCYNSQTCKPCIMKYSYKNKTYTDIIYLSDINLKYSINNVYKGTYFYIKEFFRILFK